MDIKVIGVHRIECSDAEFESALELMWGSELTGRELLRAQKYTREHFDGLRLIVIETEPVDADVDWFQLVQPDPDLDPSSWQVPYDEELVDPARGRWAFFLHYVDSDRPLNTPVGERALPSVTPLPAYLAHKKYDPPG